jgi:hypothetical protein
MNMIMIINLSLPSKARFSYIKNMVDELQLVTDSTTLLIIIPFSISSVLIIKGTNEAAGELSMRVGFSLIILVIIIVFVSLLYMLY